ncbi:MAG: MotA/TolQ/ExbB proton channel family protein [Gammaproteobacteria bacterium]
MKQQAVFSDFIFQVFSLIIALIFVHAFYVAVVRPNADAVLAQQAIMQEQNPDFVQPVSMYVVLKDYEQEAEIILMFWALAIIALKLKRNRDEAKLLDRKLLNIADGMSVLPQDAREHARALQALPPQERGYLLPRALLQGLNRFSATRSIQDVSSTVKDVCSTEADRLDSELAIVRYVAWAIPAIGFIGTVRGIGQALAQAHRAVEGDILGVTVNLGVAFNSTFVALVASILVMFLLYQLQLMQDRLVLDTQAYADNYLINHLQVQERSAP